MQPALSRTQPRPTAAGTLSNVAYALRNNPLSIAQLAACILALVLVLPAAAQSPADRSASLEADAIAAFYAGDLDTAERLLREHAKADPDNPVPHYNLACVLASRHDLEPAMEALRRSIELGFADRKQIERDPHLANLREMPAFVALLSRWNDVLDARAEAKDASLRKTFGRSYLFDRDEPLRLLYATAFTPQSFEDARHEIALVAEWAGLAVFAHAQLPADATPDAWVAVVLPKPAHFRTWAARTLGPAAVQGTSQIGGMYNHDAKELWAADLGGTLRHEFFHVLHWRSMNALGQRHPMWVQEGLAALVETVDPQGDPTPCYRTNLIRKQAKTASLVAIEQFAGPIGQRLHRDQPLRFYAQARAVFLYLLERGLLGEFYAHYTGHYRDDPTGLASLLAVTKTDAAGFDADLRSWALGLPEVPLDLGPGDAALGVRIDPASTGEGLKITGFVGRRPDGLRLGDIITHVGGRPTRDYYELVRVVSEHAPGDEIEVRYRRRTTHGTAELTLREVR